MNYMVGSIAGGAGRSGEVDVAGGGDAAKFVALAAADGVDEVFGDDV